MIRSCVLIVIFAISCHWVEKSWAQDKKPALVIDTLARSVIDLATSITEKSPCGSWANACPSQSSFDDVFVAENALSKNPLFIKQICTEDKTLEMANFERDICTKYFQISAVYNKMNVAFDFGYEVYFLEENGDLFLQSIPRKYYVNVGKFLDSAKTHSRLNKIKNKIQDKLTNKNSNTEDITDEKSFYVHDGRNMSFMWISVFQVEFDFDQLILERVFYEVRNNNRWPVSFDTSCEKDKLANEVYHKIDVHSKYSDSAQKTIFDSYMLPDEIPFAECASKICVSQWSLIPADQYHFGGLKEKICSHMTTIPIWTSTLVFPLIKVDKFIYALFQAMGSPLHVIAGITGQLRLELRRPKKRVFTENELESKIYMDMDHEKIPVPEIIYKVVKYKSDDCSEGDSCWYSATIILHNDPFFIPRKQICSDVSAEWGWGELTSVNIPGARTKIHQSNYIYVCKSEPDLLKQLMGDSAKQQPQDMKDFNLTKLPPNGQNMSVKEEVNKNLLDLTEIQDKFMNRIGILFNAIPQRGGKHLDRIEEEDIIDDDSNHDTAKPPQPKKDTGSKSEGSKEKSIGKIPLATIYRLIQIKQSEYEVKQLLLEESKNFDTTTSNNSGSIASLNGKSG